MEAKTIFAVVAEGVILPEYHTGESAGLDLRAFLKKQLTIEPGSWCSVPTGIRIELPDGYEARFVRAPAWHSSTESHV